MSGYYNDVIRDIESSLYTYIKKHGIIKRNAIDIIHTIFSYTNYQYHLTKEILRNMVKESCNVLDIEPYIKYQIQIFLDHDGLMHTLLEHLKADIVGISRVFENIRSIDTRSTDTRSTDTRSTDTRSTDTRSTDTRSTHQDNPYKEQELNCSRTTLLKDPSIPYTLHMYTPLSNITSPFIIPKHGDIVVGFKATEPVSFYIKLEGGYTISKYTLDKGEFVYAIDNSCIIPLICASWTSFYIVIEQGNHTDIKIMYALLHDNDRKTLVQHRFITPLQDGRYICYFSGHVEIHDVKPIPPHWRCIELPKCKEIVNYT